MKVYRLSDSATEALTKKPLVLSLSMGGLAVAVGSFVAFHNTQPASVWPILITLPLLIVAVVFGVHRALERQRRAWRSFGLSLSSKEIRRSMTGYPDIQIDRDEIKAIEEHQYGLVVRADRGKPGLVIPKELVGFDQVRQDLIASHGLARQGGKALGQLWSLLAATATMGVFAIVAVSTNPLIVVPLAGIMVVGAGWAIWFVRRSPHTDERTKRTIWFVLMPALAAALKALSTLGIE